MCSSIIFYLSNNNPIAIINTTLKYLTTSFMVDFKKRLGQKVTEKIIDPREIYNTLDRKSETGPLRPAQSLVLGEWFENRREDKNLIIKLHTGEGKTLIGLLILYSRLNQEKGPSLYVCPNKYLVSQVVNEAI